MKKTVNVFILFLLIHSSIVNAKDIDIFYPWNNVVEKMTLASQNEIIPILQKGTNYRIVKIDNFKGNTINKIIVNSNLTKVDIYLLPIIRDYDNNRMLDLMIPIKLNEEITDNIPYKYFLLKFYGDKSGSETVNILLKTNKAKYNISTKVAVTQQEFISDMSLNVWAYFDYNFLLKGLKNQVISDLYQHKVNSIVIPPYALPNVENITKDKVNELRRYLQGTSNKFQYYLLYLGGFIDKENNMMTPQWKKNFPLWYKTVMSVFSEFNISKNKVLFYPIDEPHGQNIEKIFNMYDYLIQKKINMSFFCTIDNKSAMYLAKKLEYIQVLARKTEILEEINSIKGKKTKILIYESSKFSKSRNIIPLDYVKMGLKAYCYSADGIGIWNYADVSKLFTNKGLKEFENKKKGSWEIEINNPGFDYSLIYRKGNILYSSIRWEALSYGLEDNFWLKLYEKKYGVSAGKKLVEQLLENRINLKQWEEMKLMLLYSFEE